MNVSEIRGFLLRSPKPAKVRVLTAEGEEKSITAKSYAKAAETIFALEPELIECLDKDGNLLRAKRAGGAAVNPSDEPDVPEVLAKDPQAAAFAQYARYLAKAYEHSTEVAFARMIELVERLGDRSENIERRLERAEAERRRVEDDLRDAEIERVEEQAAQQAEGGGIGEKLVQSFLGGVATQPEPSPPPATRTRPRTSNGHSNGKGQA